VAMAFKELQAHRLWLDVKVHNARARSLYKSEGFSEEGLLRECFRGPVGFESLVVMALLHNELK
jgi:diamine N-acetyltransferase